MLYNDGSQCVEILRREASNQIVATATATGFLECFTMVVVVVVRDRGRRDCKLLDKAISQTHHQICKEEKHSPHGKKVLSSNHRMLKKGARERAMKSVNRQTAEQVVELLRCSWFLSWKMCDAVEDKCYNSVSVDSDYQSGHRVQHT